MAIQVATKDGVVPDGNTAKRERISYILSPLKKGRKWITLGGIFLVDPKRETEFRIKYGI